MSKADEMFEELGYYETEKYANGIEYINEIEDKTIGFMEYGNDGKVVTFTIFEDFINMQELQAINEKVKELGWNEKNV